MLLPGEIWRIREREGFLASNPRRDARLNRQKSAEAIVGWLDKDQVKGRTLLSH
jgi:hypothetical protein